MTPAQFLELLASITLQSATVIVVTYWLCRIVDVPRIQCRLWNTCYLLLLGLILVAAVLPHLRVAHPWRMLSERTAEQLASAESAIGQFTIVGWILGVAVSLLLLAREWMRALSFLKTCAPLETPIEELIGLADPTVRTQGKVQLLTSPRIGSPFCCQWHRPHLVLPEFMKAGDRDELAFVVRHELEHLSSGHPLQLFIERVVEMLLWFHPMIWWASQQSSLARECACDDAAVNDRQQVVSYLKVLLAIAERGLNREADGAMLFFGRGASVVALRGRRLVKQVQEGRRTASLALSRGAQAAIAAVGLCSCLVWAPLDVLASSRTSWSPWPKWSAAVLQSFDIPARDFEPYDARSRVFELEELQRDSAGLSRSTLAP